MYFEEIKILRGVGGGVWNFPDPPSRTAHGEDRGIFFSKFNHFNLIDQLIHFRNYRNADITFKRS